MTYYEGIYYARKRNSWTFVVIVDKKLRWFDWFDDEFTALKTRDCAYRYFGMDKKLYFANHEVTTQDWLLFHQIWDRKRGKEGLVTKREKNLTDRKARLAKKFVHIQKMLPG